MARNIEYMPQNIAPYTIEIFQKLAEGHTKQEICRDMGISSAVYNHRINYTRNRHDFKTNEHALATLIKKGLVKLN